MSLRLFRGGGFSSFAEALPVLLFGFVIAGHFGVSFGDLQHA
jgi:hypothetical protein